MTKLLTNASSATWWSKLESMQVAPSGHLVAMQVAPPGCQNWNQCKLRYMLAKFGTNASGATYCSIFELIQVEPHTIGQI